MPRILRQIIAILFLVAYAATGQLTACACDFLPVQSACQGHDHSHEDPVEHEHSCECLTCHHCSHATFVLTALPVMVPALQSDSPVPSHGSGFASLVLREIFTPPKLTA